MSPGWSHQFADLFFFSIVIPPKYPTSSISNWLQCGPRDKTNSFLAVSPSPKTVLIHWAPSLLLASARKAQDLALFHSPVTKFQEVSCLKKMLRLSKTVEFLIRIRTKLQSSGICTSQFYAVWKQKDKVLVNFKQGICFLWFKEKRALGRMSFGPVIKEKPFSLLPQLDSVMVGWFTSWKKHFNVSQKEA